ncbi:condensation domain-containing protein [Paeniglutamicibacter kerguelensis]|uniref:condensation domain-containing protein n=1 Tax=Paeniglutamicibacter kerguelensis TaxID=254788 RepID=UPI003613771C
MDATPHRRSSAGSHSYATSLAMFAAVVAAWTRQDDLLIGSPVDLRTDPRLEGSIGYYVNMLPMRLPVSWSASVADHIVGVRDVVLEALDHRSSRSPISCRR